MIPDNELVWRVCDLGGIGGEATCNKCPPTVHTKYYGEGKQMCRCICEDIIEAVRTQPMDAAGKPETVE